MQAKLTVVLGLLSPAQSQMPVETGPSECTA